MKRKKQREIWCQNHLADQQLPQLLFKVDSDVAEAVRQQLCGYCGSPLHWGNYPRKPRGAPVGDRRFSFCCSNRDCRRRRTPPSVRFLGRKVYAGFVVVLLSAMRHGIGADRMAEIRRVIGVDRRTLEHWRQWWLENFARSGFWKAARAEFMPPLCEPTLPWSLCQAFGVDRRQRLLDLLQFLAPITVANPLEDRAM